MQNPIAEAVVSMTEIVKEEILGIKIAMEIITLTRSFFKDDTWEFTVKIVKPQNEEVLFFSSLSEDEARFWRYPVDMIKNVDRPGVEGSMKKEAINIEGMNVLWIIEDQNKEIPPLTEEENSILEIASLLCRTCILAEESRCNLQIDALTGLRGKKDFERNIEKEKKKSAYLLAVKNANSARETDSRLLKLSEVCKEIQSAEVFRIDTGVLAFFPEHKEEAFSNVQQLMELVPEVAVFVMPTKQIEISNALKKIVAELARTEEGKISDTLWSQKPIFKEIK